MTEEDRIRIRAFLAELLRHQNDTAPFTDAAPLVSTGRLDSRAVIKLVDFLETESSVDFTRIEFDPQRFDTLDSLAAMVDDWHETGL